MAININEDGVLKPLNIETTGWQIKGLDFLGELIYRVPGKTDNTIQASASNPLVVKGASIKDYLWFALQLDRPIGEYKYFIFIPEAQANTSDAAYMTVSETNRDLFPMFFNPTEMWRVWDYKQYALGKNGFGFPITAGYPSYPWTINISYMYNGAKCFLNELTDTTLYLYNTHTGYPNYYFTILGLR